MTNPIPPKHKPTGYTDSIDFKSVVKEAVAAMDSEEKYQRENDAKFRAVYQKVGTYDEFRDIVLASNLKPLDKTDSLSVKIKGTWNVNATHSEDQMPDRTSEHKPQYNLPSFVENISSQSEFYQIYRNLSQLEKYQFILNIDGDHILALFPTELEVFDDIMNVLSREFKAEDSDNILHLMAQLSCMKRFSLSILFMDKSTKLNVESLMKLIADLIGSSPPNEAFQKVVSRYT